jgi:hypothetical protein
MHYGRISANEARGDRISGFTRIILQILRILKSCQKLWRTGRAEAFDDPVAEGAGVVFDRGFVEG